MVTEGQDPVSRVVASRVRAGRMPGVVWRVEDRDGVVSHGSFGLACVVPSPEPLSEGTPFDLASLTKSLATAVIAVLLEDLGLIDLDDSAAVLLPELEGTPYAEATFLDLGTHQAGLPAWWPLYVEANDVDGFVQTIAGLAPEGPRGNTRYSDLGYVLLGAAIERAARERLDRLFERLVAFPLGLRSTGFAGGGRQFAAAAATERGNGYERSLAGDRAKAYRFREALIRGVPHDGNAFALGGVAGHAGLFGTAAEVAAIAREILNPNVVPWSRRALARLLLPAAGEGSRTFGFVLACESDAARSVLPDHAPGHTGFTGTSVWIDPAAGRVYVLLTNRVHPHVPADDFQDVRRDFHAAAGALVAGRGA